MNRRMFSLLAMAASAFLMPAPALAHHGRALIYDAKKETTVKATVTEFVWSNPHVQIGIEAVDADGTRRQWLLEASSTGILADRGWSRKSLKPGGHRDCNLPSGPARRPYRRFGQGRVGRWQGAAGRSAAVTDASGEILHVRNQFLIALAGLLGAVTFISGCSSRPAVPTAPQHPDISGVWLGGGKGSWSTTRAKPGTEPDIPYTAWALERMKGQRPGSGSESDFENTTDPALKYADPLGFPRQYQHPLKFKIVQTDDYIYQLWEWNKVWRQIPLNKPHSDDPDISWYGESVGKWEGDTLVVDSIGFKDSTWLDGVGHPHSEELHVIERIRRVDPQTLQIDFTFEDPVAYTHPWTSQHTFKLVPGGKMTEVVTTMSDELHYRERFLKQKPPVPIRR